MIEINESKEIDELSERSELKDKAIFLAWVTGLLLLLCMLWIITQPLQANYLMRTINSVLINNNDSRRVFAYVPQKSANAGLFGYRYSMLSSQDEMFVFGFFSDGVLIPIGAVISPAGEVKELLPLSAHAAQVFDVLPESILRMYVMRIEGRSE